MDTLFKDRARSKIPTIPSLGQASGEEDGSASSAEEDPNFERPEAFRKPFASLPPTSEVGGQGLDYFGRHRTPSYPPSPSLGRQASPAPTAVAVPSVRPRNPRTYCTRHRLAKNPQGLCMLCEREAKSNPELINWKVPVTLVSLAIVIGVLAAAYL